MYEDTKFNSNINWKSLLIKLIILLVIVFIICFLIFKPKKDNNFISLVNNITQLKDAAILYYKDNMSLENIGDYDKVTLKELIKEDYIKEQEDSDGNSCDTKKSYAYLTKTRDDQFVLKIKMSCGKKQESKTFNLTDKDLIIVATKEEEIIEPEIKEEEIIVEEDKIDKKPSKEEDKELADNSQHVDFENDKLIEELHDPNSTKKVKYKHIKYGSWIEGEKYGDNIENSTKTIKYYDYCYNDYCVLDRLDNASKYEGYTATYNRSEEIPVYRYIFVIWSNSSCIKGFINTGIAEYR